MDKREVMAVVEKYREIEEGFKVRNYKIAEMHKRAGRSDMANKHSATASQHLATELLLDRIMADLDSLDD